MWANRLKYRLRQWPYDLGVRHYCHRCDRFIWAWNTCRHNLRRGFR